MMAKMLWTISLKTDSKRDREKEKKTDREKEKEKEEGRTGTVLIHPNTRSSAPGDNYW